MSVEYKPMNINQFLADLNEAFYDSIDEFIKEELPIEHIPMSVGKTRSGSLRKSRYVTYGYNKVTIAFADRMAGGAIYTHWFDNLATNWTTPGTMSHFLDYPIKYRGKRIWSKLNKKMKARGYN